MTMVIKMLKKNKIMVVTDCTNLGRTERKNEMKMINHDCGEQRKPEDNLGYNSNNSTGQFFIKTQVYHVTPVWTNKMPAMAPITTDTPSTSFTSVLHYLLVKQLSCTAVTFLSINVESTFEFSPDLQRIYNYTTIAQKILNFHIYRIIFLPQIIFRCGSSNES
jgi:hypothetical protein